MGGERARDVVREIKERRRVKKMEGRCEFKKVKVCWIFIQQGVQWL